MKPKASQFTAAQKAEAKRKRALAKDGLWPILVKHSANIEEAKILLNVASTAVRQSFNNRMLKTSVEELELISMLADSPEKKKYEAILNLVAGENIVVALELIDGMSQAIDGFIKQENSERKLDKLKTYFL